jgi:hypothetical protein
MARIRRTRKLITAFHAVIATDIRRNLSRLELTDNKKPTSRVGFLSSEQR